MTVSKLAVATRLERDEVDQIDALDLGSDRAERLRMLVRYALSDTAALMRWAEHRAEPRTVTPTIGGKTRHVSHGPGPDVDEHDTRRHSRPARAPGKQHEPASEAPVTAGKDDERPELPPQPVDAGPGRDAGAPPRLLTPEEVADRLSVDKSWVYRAARTALIPTIKVGRWVRFHPDAVEDFIAKGGAGAED